MIPSRFVCSTTALLVVPLARRYQAATALMPVPTAFARSTTSSSSSSSSSSRVHSSSLASSSANPANDGWNRPPTSKSPPDDNDDGSFVSDVVPILEEVQVDNNNHASTVSIDWDNRLRLQNDLWSNEQKGWRVAVEWKETSDDKGVGLFASQDIAQGTVLRRGILNRNLKQFETVQDILQWCGGDDPQNKQQQQQLDLARLRYVKDYLWGFCTKTDERGYYSEQTDGEDWFFGMWVPGNGLNHHQEPNTVYRATPQGINLVALTDIFKGDELYDDYRRHGSAPAWLQQFATTHQVTLNFADCNDFVNPSDE